MVESIMIFLLGFLAAALLALLVIPALNARAERLVRRRLEAQFPLSIGELTAEKDHLRAEFAVKERRLERRVEEALATKHADMEEMGRRALRIEALDTTVAERDGRIAELEKELADTQARLVRTSDDLEATRASLAATRDTLSALDAAHRATLQELGETRQRLDETIASLNETRTDLFETRERLAARNADYLSLDERYTEALNEISARRITISDLETRLAMQTTRGDEFERSLADRRSELSAERQRIADIARNLVAEQERGLVLEQRNRALEAERDARGAEAARLNAALSEMRAERKTLAATLDERQAHGAALEERLAQAESRFAALAPDGQVSDVDQAAQLAALGDQLREARTEKAHLEGALATARDERAKLQRELNALRRNPNGATDEIRAENALLLSRIDEVADQIMAAGRAQGSEPEAPATEFSEAEDPASADEEAGRSDASLMRGKRKGRARAKVSPAPVAEEADALSTHRTSAARA